MKLLVVDDSKMIRDRLNALLLGVSKIGAIAEADSVQTALWMFRDIRPDLVLLDMHLPDGDGIEVLRAIRDELPETQVLVMTRFPEYRNRCLELRADGFFDKSGDMDRLIGEVRLLAMVHHQRHQPKADKESET